MTEVIHGLTRDELVKHVFGENEMSKAIQDVLAERQRQQDIEGYTTDSDDRYTGNEMTAAAVAYSGHVVGRGWVHLSRPENYQAESCPSIWPWDESWWKPKSPRQDLVRATALLIAEIERMDRASNQKQRGE